MLNRLITKYSLDTDRFLNFQISKNGFFFSENEFVCGFSTTIFFGHLNRIGQICYNFLQIASAFEKRTIFIVEKSP